MSLLKLLAQGHLWFEPHAATLRRYRMSWVTLRKPLGIMWILVLSLVTAKLGIAVFGAVANLERITPTAEGARLYLTLLLSVTVARWWLISGYFAVLMAVGGLAFIVSWLLRVCSDLIYYDCFHIASAEYLLERRRALRVLRLWWGPAYRRFSRSCTVAALAIGGIVLGHDSSDRMAGILLVSFSIFAAFAVFGLQLFLHVAARHRHEGSEEWKRLERVLLSRESLRGTLKEILVFVTGLGLLGRFVVPLSLVLCAFIEQRMGLLIYTLTSYGTSYGKLVAFGFHDRRLPYHLAWLPLPNDLLAGPLIGSEISEMLSHHGIFHFVLNGLFAAATIATLLGVAIPALLKASIDIGTRTMIVRVIRSTVFSGLIVGATQVAVDFLYMVHSSRFLSIGFLFSIVLSILLALQTADYDR